MGRPFVDHELDHLDPKFWGDLHHSTSELRERCPVARSSAHGGFVMVTRFEDAIRVLRDPGTFCSGLGVTVPEFGQQVRSIPVESDPPFHSYFRQIAWDWFTPNAIARFEPEIAAIVEDVLSGIEGRCEVDLISEVAALIPPRVIARRCGVPDDLVETFSRLIEDQFAAAAVNDPAQAAEAFNRFYAYIGDLLDDARESPRGDVISAIANAQIGDRPINRDEALGLLLTTLVGGHETTIHAIGFLLAHVAQLPDRSILLADPSQSLAAIDESLRLESPFQFFARTVTSEVQFGDEVLPPDSKVLVAFGAANRDPRMFADPDDFRLDRSANRHIAFGYGIHKCLGQHLARAELRIVLEQMLTRFPEYRINESSVPKPVLKAIMWGLPALPAVL